MIFDFGTTITNKHTIFTEFKYPSLLVFIIHSIAITLMVIIKKKIRVFVMPNESYVSTCTWFLKNVHICFEKPKFIINHFRVERIKISCLQHIVDCMPNTISSVRIASIVIALYVIHPKRGKIF